jgi:thiol-disulfide isomerase/thioredoxin
MLFPISAACSTGTDSMRNGHKPDSSPFLETFKKCWVPLIVKEEAAAAFFQREQYLSEKMVVVDRWADGPGCENCFPEAELFHSFPIFTSNVVKVAPVKPIRDRISNCSGVN